MGTVPNGKVELPIEESSKGAEDDGMAAFSIDEDGLLVEGGVMDVEDCCKIGA